MSSLEGNNPPLPDVGRCPDFFNMENPCQGNVLEDFDAAGEHTGELICSRDDCRLKANEGGGAKAEAPDARRDRQELIANHEPNELKGLGPDYPPMIEIPERSSSEPGTSLHFKRFDFQDLEGLPPPDRESFSHFLMDEDHLFPRQDNPDSTSPEVFGSAILDTTKGPDGTFNVVAAETPLDGLLRHARQAYQDYLRRVEAQNENPDPSVTQIPLKEVAEGGIPPHVKILNDLPNAAPRRIDELGVQPYYPLSQRRLSTFEILELLLGGKKADEASESNPPLSLGAQIKQERDEEIAALYAAAVKGEPADLPESLSIPPEALNWPRSVDSGDNELKGHGSDLNTTPPPFLEESHGAPLSLDGPSRRVSLTDKERKVLDPDWATSEDGSHFEKKARPDTTTKGFGYVAMTGLGSDTEMSSGTGVPPEASGQYFEERSRTIDLTGEEA